MARKKTSPKTKPKKSLGARAKPSTIAKPSYADLLKENQALRRELVESAEQQMATSDILRMIARAPAEFQSVLDSIAERVATWRRVATV